MSKGIQVQPLTLAQTPPKAAYNFRRAHGKLVMPNGTHRSWDLF